MESRHTLTVFSMLFYNPKHQMLILPSLRCTPSIWKRPLSGTSRSLCRTTKPLLTVTKRDTSLLTHPLALLSRSAKQACHLRRGAVISDHTSTTPGNKDKHVKFTVPDEVTERMDLQIIPHNNLLRPVPSPELTLGSLPTLQVGPAITGHEGATKAGERTAALRPLPLFQNLAVPPVFSQPATGRSH